ncbi:MAG: rpoE [Armatimonadetes bacterium]|jgi:RNA polymerase sigma-70 factor (ECF subfamily)|nr:rpoE [Armatimonadota bacterium]
MWLIGRRNAEGVDRPRVTLPLADLSDAHLVREAKLGNTAAYGELTSRYQDRIFTFVLGQVASREDAVDLTQEVFVKGHTKLGHFREDALFYTWLYRIAVNTCIDFRRRRGRSAEPFSLDANPETELGYELREERIDYDPARVLENKELGRYLRVCIQALPEVLRLAVILHDIEGLPQKDIAQILNCPLGTVKSRIQRGRYELRERLLPFLSGQNDELP